MSFLRSGGRGVRKAGAVFAAMLVFQVLAVVGAGSASAVAAAGCSFNAGTGEVTITQTASNEFEVFVNEDGEIRVFDIATGVVDCGSATIENTTTVTVLGGGVGATNEVVEIENNDRDDGQVVGNPECAPGGAECQAFSGQSFVVDLGEGAADIDEFSWQGSEDDDEVVLGGTQNNLTGTVNGDSLLVVGADTSTGLGAGPGIRFDGAGGDDTFDGDGTTARTRLDGEDDNDTIMPGLGADQVIGGAGDGDHVIYDRGTSPVSVSLNSVATDADDGANCTNDVTDFNTPTQGTCEGDDVWGFEIVETGGGNDYLEGDEAAALDEVFLPGEGDDETVGNGGDDTTAWSNCTGPVRILVADATTTGCGTDVWDTENVAGSPAANGETIPNRIPQEGPGGAGDWLDFSGEAGGIFVNLDGGGIVNGDWDPIENVLGTEGDDEIIGDENGNVLNGSDGNDILDGEGGNDMLVGAGGNDEFTGGGGADAVYFGFAENGVTVDLSLGFATGEGSDTFTGGIPGVDVEIVFGSSFNDDITGGLTGAGSGVNFRFHGKGGNDNLTGSDSNDFLAGGRGNDVMRGGAGLDTLKGGKGEDWGYGGPGNDICRKSTEHKRSCGRRG